MRGRRIVKVFKVALIVLIFAVIFSLAVLRLWNWLMPALFGLHSITYWQALGLLVLTRILFGGFRGRPHYGAPWRSRMMERWAKMTPEEREKFRQGMRDRCGHFGPPTAETKA